MRRISSVITTTVVFITLLVLSTSANTEIRNFDAPMSGFAITKDEQRTFETQFGQRGGEIVKVLRTGDGENLLNVRALRKETERESEVESALWLKLELDTSAKHTIRVSWPAFYPTDFDVSLYRTSEELLVLSQRLGLATKATYNETYQSLGRDDQDVSCVYVRIQATHTGIMDPRKAASSLNHNYNDLVPIIVVIEPLLLGGLPHSLIPSIIAIVLLVVGATFALSPILRFLDSVAREAQKEISQDKERKE